MSKKDFIKITFQDIEIAESFFENDKHLSEFLVNVIRYYRQKPTKFNSKIVQKYFKTYQKTMDYILEAKKAGKYGAEIKAENQALKADTLEGGLEETLKAKKKEKRKNKEEERDKKSVYREFEHLSLSVYDYKRLNYSYTKEEIDDILDKIENYKDVKKYKSLYLTAKDWLKRAFPNVDTKNPRFVNGKEVLFYHEGKPVFAPTTNPKLEDLKK